MELTFDDTQAAALLDALGLPPDTTDPATIVATAADLAAQVQAVDPAKPATVAAAAKRNGLEVIDAAALSALKHDAAEGRRVAAAAARAKIEADVEAAVNRGAIAASRRAHWVSVIEADPASAQVLAGLPDEMAVPMTELGHSTEKGIAEPADWFYPTT